SLVPWRKNPRCGVAGIEQGQQLHGGVPGFDGFAFLVKRLSDGSKLLQVGVVLGKAHRPPAAGQQQAGKGAGIQGALPPIDAAHFLLVQAGQCRFREYDFAQQMMNEACPPGAKAGKGLAGNAELTTDFNGSGVQLLLKLRGAGQVEAAQLAGALIAIAAERQFVEQAKFVANLAQLPRKVEDATATQRIALLMHAQDHLAVQAPEQLFELLTDYLKVCAVLILGKLVPSTWSLSSRDI